MIDLMQVRILSFTQGINSGKYKRTVYRKVKRIENLYIGILFGAAK